MFSRILKFSLSSALLTTLAFASQCTEKYGSGAQELKLATGSPGELGLVKVLAEDFASKNNISLCWIKAGSGESLSMLKKKEVDMIMVHAPKAEKEAIKDGWASNRTLIGSNEFYITGPKNDPALIKDSTNAKEAYSQIANKKALFYTRGDNSGTHKKELAIWEMAKITPQGEWYTTNKDFMLATLKKADETGAYFMTDSSTWVAAKKNLKNQKILFRGDVILINTYNALKQNGLDTDNQKMSAKFIEFVANDEGQKVIGTFGKELYGEAIYNDAAYAKQYNK